MYASPEPLPFGSEKGVVKATLAVMVMTTLPLSGPWKVRVSNRVPMPSAWAKLAPELEADASSTPPGRLARAEPFETTGRAEIVVDWVQLALGPEVCPVLQIGSRKSQARARV